MNGFPRTDCFIGGGWLATAEALPVVDPSTGEDFGSIARGGPAEIDAAVTAARTAADGDWGRTPAAERGRVLARIGRLVEERVEDLALLDFLFRGQMPDDDLEVERVRRLSGRYRARGHELET